MKYTSAVLALASVGPAAASFRDIPGFRCPSNTNNQCNTQQQSGFDWSTLGIGSFSSYGSFDFNGWTCKDVGFKRDLLTGRSSGGKAICGSAGHAKESSPSFGCGSSSDVSEFSISTFEIEVEFDTDLEFYYQMPDGSSCKHRSPCSKGGSSIENSQCGGAKSVTVVYPSQTAHTSTTCSVSIHSMSFSCGSATATTAFPKTTSEVKTTSSATSAKTTTAPETKTTKQTAPGTTAPGTTKTSEQTSPTTAPGTTAPGTTAPGTTKTSEQTVPGTNKTSPATSVPPTQTTQIVSTFQTTFLSTSTVFTTNVVTITSCAATVTNCPAESKTVAIVTQTVIASTTICPVTQTGTTTLTVQTSSAVGTTSTKDVKTTVSKPGETSTKAVGTTSNAVGTTSTKAVGTTSKAVGTTSTVPTPVETLPCPNVVPACLNTWLFTINCDSNTDSDCYCPEAAFVENIFSCLYSRGETDDIIQEAVEYFQGICAGHADHNPAIVTGAATVTTIITAAPTATPTAVYTTIQVTATTVVPCSQSGTTIKGSSTTVVVTTAMTVPQVTFATTSAGTATTNDVVLVPAVTTPVAASGTGAVATSAKTKTTLYTMGGTGTGVLPSATTTSPVLFTAAAAPRGQAAWGVVVLGVAGAIVAM